MKKNLLVISDGNGVDNDFKKWPTLIKALAYDSLTVDNRSVVGASNELILMQLSEALATSKVDCAIIQWTDSNRVDIVADDFWREEAVTDSYSFNIINSNNRDWWVTSVSKNKHIRLYHDRYIKSWQAKQRSQAYMLAAAKLLGDIPYVFTLAYEFQFEEPMDREIKKLNWVWHEENLGLSEYRLISDHKELDQGLPQPHNAIQLEWLHKIVKPKCDFIDYPEKRYHDIEEKLSNVK